MSSAAAADTRTLWHDITAPAPAAAAKTGLPKQTTAFRTLTLDFNDLKNALADVPFSNVENGGFSSKSAGSIAPVKLALPLPEGTAFTEFQLFDSGTLPPTLAQRYPEIRSLRGSDSKGRQLRLDISPQGMKAMVYDEKGAWLVQPIETLGGKVAEAKATGGQYSSFRRAALPASATPFHEGEISKILPSPDKKSGSAKFSNQSKTVTGTIRRDFRIAVAASSKYTATFGGTIKGGLAAVTTMINRVNEVYEKDLGIHFTLVNDNDKIIYTDPKKDPYNIPVEPEITYPSRVIAKNVLNLDKVVGKRNFDIGHVVDTGSGGQAGTIGNSCSDEPGDKNKAAGTTGRPDPVGDAFSIDYVAHELGHQLGAWHSFDQCTLSNGRTTIADSSVEPGGGTTVMAYAGICAPNENIQLHSDPYFHGISLDQINAWVSAKGGACAAKKLNDSVAPFIDVSSLSSYDENSGTDKVLSIPTKTPFSLRGKATGAVGAAMTYAWEEFDVGPKHNGRALIDDGKNPIFRSSLPSASGERTFPRMAAILGYEPLGNGEVYPAKARTLHFRLTARDNLGQQAATASSDDLMINVIDTGGAFAITAPVKAAVFAVGSTQTVKWAVSKTDQAPISCANVKIDLSTDGGYTYLATPLAKSVANNGSASVKLPKSKTKTGRIKVSCADNVFFAVSPANFEIN
ncbi:reprolysin-like metallopeptidase [Collimonas humicola]|uniref:reprolysin-like metallopeptidase n=1 Tax=Collimonas humicola TaxID=2825886 RepID=UPI001B8B7C78|nr:zinc-dependent metalloprotease family protein [Collimonas humicola]